MTDRATDPSRPAPPASEEGGFLGRWSRRKRAAEAGVSLPEAPAPVAPQVVPASAAIPAELPDPATLGADADFSAYLQARVPQQLKQAAMRKLFSDPAFNRMDGLDVYIDDYNQLPDLPAAEAALLTHVRETLLPGSTAVEREAASASSSQAGDPATAATLTGGTDDASSASPEASGPSEEMPT